MMISWIPVVCTFSIVDFRCVQMVLIMHVDCRLETGKYVQTISKSEGLELMFMLLRGLKQFNPLINPLKFQHTLTWPIFFTYIRNDFVLCLYVCAQNTGYWIEV